MIKSNYHTHLKYCNHADGVSEDYVKEVIPEIPAEYRVWAVISIGYADYTPKPLPEYEGPERIIIVE